MKIGKIRSLQICANENGVFTILAIDHRDALRVLLNREAPASVSAEEMTAFKLSVVNALAPASSALLLDPLYSAPQAIASRLLPPQAGLLIAIEEQGYLGDPFSRRTNLLTGWSVEKAKRLGAQGIKLLLLFHPGAGNAVEAQLKLVNQVASDCDRYEIPLFLEPISYSLDAGMEKRSAEFTRERPGIVIESTRQMCAAGADILKVEFPVDAQYDADTSVWIAACLELDAACQIPWVLLSGGEPYETFREQVRIACEAGCSGFLVGRAIWQEAAGLDSQDRETYLHEVALPRLIELGQIARRYGKPWHSRYQAPAIGEYWYRSY